MFSPALALPRQMALSLSRSLIWAAPALGSYSEEGRFFISGVWLGRRGRVLNAGRLAFYLLERQAPGAKEGDKWTK